MRASGNLRRVLSAFIAGGGIIYEYPGADLSLSRLIHALEKRLNIMVCQSLWASLAVNQCAFLLTFKPPAPAQYARKKCESVVLGRFQGLDLCPDTPGDAQIIRSLDKRPRTRELTCTRQPPPPRDSHSHSKVPGVGTGPDKRNSSLWTLTRNTYIHPNSLEQHHFLQTWPRRRWLTHTCIHRTVRTCPNKRLDTRAHVKSPFAPYRAYFAVNGVPQQGFGPSRDGGLPFETSTPSRDG